MWCTALTGALLAAAVGFFFILNPMLFGFDTGIPHDRFYVYDSQFMLDGELVYVKQQLGDDFDAYRNHCLRIMSYIRFQLPDAVYDTHSNAMNVIGMIVAFHRVGLWTDGELNYLESSVKKMEEIVGKEGIWDDEFIDIARQAILNQHKLSEFKGSGNNVTDIMVETIRKATWADATMGIVRYDLPAPLIEAAFTKLPSKGFHETLFGMGPRLSPNNFLGQFDLVKVVRR